MSILNQSGVISKLTYMNPFEMVGYVALGFVPTLIAMKIGWDLARKKLMFSYLKRDNVYSTAEPAKLTARN
ncbi:MAG: hypothetical protein GEU26_05930 [Nitrososphaeraceae archaeon]|nr:hypothetical protein [Nitrososphaeraceae archaeon]